MGFFSSLFGPSEEEKEQQKENERRQAAEEKKEAKKREWEDPNEKVKYVCEGGKVQCKYCSSPIASIKVTAQTEKLQDKPWATVGDNNGKVNFGFTGLCTHPKWGSHKPPCTSVIALGEWKDYADTIVGQHNALMVQSTIPCMVSNEDLKIVHSGQTASLDKVNPLDFRKWVLDAFWLDRRDERRDLYINVPVTLYVQIRDTKPGDVVTLPFNTKGADDSESTSFTGTVNEDGYVEIENFMLKLKDE